MGYQAPNFGANAFFARGGQSTMNRIVAAALGGAQLRREGGWSL